MNQLRPDQWRMMDAVLNCVRRGQPGRNPLCIAPTGFGKGEVAAHVIVNLTHQDQGHRVLFAVHLREIANDIRSRVLAFGTDPSRFAVVTLQSLVKNGAPFAPDVVIVDEAHRSKAVTYAAAVKKLIGGGASLVGFTATGQRGDGSGLGPVGYDVIVQGPSTAELAAAGLIAPVKVFAPSEAVDEMAETPQEAIGPAGGKAIVFCSSIDHSKAETHEFLMRGVSAAHVDGKTRNRQRLLDMFKMGAFQVLTNERLFVEGIDVPDVTTVILASKFSHAGPYLQAIGRGRRTHPGKTHLTLLDLYGNVHNHGLPDDPRAYSLDAEAIRLERDTLPAAVQCRSCLAWGRGGACQFCGKALPKPPPPKLTKRELIEIRHANVKKQGPEWETWKSLVNEQRQKGYKNQWAPLAYRRIFGSMPRWTLEMVE